MTDLVRILDDDTLVSHALDGLLPPSPELVRRLADLARKDARYDAGYAHGYDAGYADACSDMGAQPAKEKGAPCL
jgi:hypothetical protein